jgi:hypothetical protein
MEQGLKRLWASQKAKGSPTLIAENLLLKKWWLSIVAQLFYAHPQASILSGVDKLRA